MSAALPLPDRMSIDEFLVWSAANEGRWQLIDGEPRAMAPPALIHAFLQSELSGRIRNHLRDRCSPCDVYTGPGVIPATMAARNMRVPDLMVSCVPVELGQITAREPVVLIEILSPGNRADTWMNVWAYSSIPSVCEILVLRSESVGADVLRRKPDGTWPDQPTPVDEGELTLDSIGFRVPLAELYERTPLSQAGS